MKEYLKRLFSDSAVFAIATMGNKLVAALLSPIYFRLLQEGEMADWGIVNSFTLILTYICILGTDAAMAYYYYDAKDPQERKTYFTNAIIFSAGVCAVLTILVYLFGAPLSDIVFPYAKYDYSMLLPTAFLATMGAIVIQHILGYARYSRRVLLFNIFSMLYVIGSNLLSIFFLAVYKVGVMGIFYGQLIGQGTVALILLFIFRKEFVLHFSKKHISDLIKYGAPLLPSLVAFWMMTALSKPMITFLAGRISGDIFEASIRLASIVVLITSPFQLAWRPFIMSIKDREDAPKVFGLVGRGLLVVGTIAILLITFVIEPIYTIYVGVDEKPYLAPGYLYVWALSLGTLLNVLHTVFGVGLLIRKKTSLISQGFFLAAGVFTVGSLLLIPFFGIGGSVTMTVLSYLIVVCWVYYHNQKIFPVEFRFLSILSYLIFFIGIMIGVSWVQAMKLENSGLYYLFAFVLTIIAVFATRVFSIGSLNQLGRLLPKLVRKG